MNKLIINRLETKERLSNLNINSSTSQSIDSNEYLRYDQVESLIDTISYQDDVTQKSSHCVITLKNGYKLIGKSCLDSDEAFDRELVQKMAYFSAMTEVCKAAHLLMLERQYQLRQSDSI